MGTIFLDKMHLRSKCSMSCVLGTNSRCWLGQGLWESIYPGGTSLPLASVALVGGFGHNMHYSWPEPMHDPCFWPPTHTFPRSQQSLGAGGWTPTTATVTMQKGFSHVH